MPRSHSLFYSIWGFSRSTADLTSFPRIFGPSQPIKKQQDIVHSQTGMNWPIKGKMSKACCLLFLLKFHCFSNAVNWPLLIRNWRGLIMDGFLFTNLQDWIKNKMRIFCSSQKAKPHQNGLKNEKLPKKEWNVPLKWESFEYFFNLQNGETLQKYALRVFNLKTPEAWLILLWLGSLKTSFEAKQKRSNAQERRISWPQFALFWAE